MLPGPLTQVVEGLEWSTVAGLLTRPIPGLLDAVRPLWVDEDGVSSMEYALLLCVIAVGAVVAFGHLGQTAKKIAEKSSYTLERAAGMGCYRR